MLDIMTKERFDQYKNKILKLSEEAGVFWEQFNELKTAKDMVVRLARKQKRQMDLMEDDRQKTNEEIKILRFELKKAQEKIKDLEQEKMKSNDSDAIEPDPRNNGLPPDDTLDLESLAHDIDTKLAKKEEEETYNYIKKMDMDF